MATGADFYVRGDVSIDAAGAQKGVNETSEAAQQAAEKIGQSAQNAAATVEAAGEQAQQTVSTAAQSAASAADTAAKQAAESAAASMQQAAKQARAAGSEMADGLTAGVESAKGTLADYRRDVAKLANAYIEAGESSSDAWKRAYSEIDKSLYDFTGQAKEAAHEAEDTAQNAANRVQQTISAKTIAIGNLVSTAVQKLVSEVAQIGKQAVSTGIQYNAQIEQYGVALTTLLGDAETAQTALANIQADAAVTPFDTASLVQANEFLIAAGENAEYSRRAINALGDAVSATGGGSDALSRMAQNLQQIANAGEATAADIKQFAYAGIDVYGILADYTGKTTADVKDMKISYEDLTGALIKASEEGGRFYGAMDTQGQTLNGRLETLKDNASQLIGALTEGLFEGEKDLIEAAIGWVDTLSAALKEEGPAAMMEAAADIVAGIAQGIADNAYSVGEKAAAIIASFTNSISECLPDVLSVAADIASGFVAGLADHFDEIIAAGIELLANLVVGIIGALPKLIEAAGTAVIKFVAAVDGNLPEVLAAGAKLLESFVNGIFSVFDSLINIAVSAVDTFAGELESNADKLKNSGTFLGNALGSALDSTAVSWMNAISSKVAQWAKEIKTFIDDLNPTNGAEKDVRNDYEWLEAQAKNGNTQAAEQLAKLKAQEAEKNTAAAKARGDKHAARVARSQADAAAQKAAVPESSITTAPAIDTAKTTKSTKSTQKARPPRKRRKRP